MTLPLSERLRAVLSDETQKLAWFLADHKCSGRARGVCGKCDRRADAISLRFLKLIEPFLLDLQEEQAREMRATFERWLTQGYTDQGETPLDDYGLEVVREVLSSLASSSSPAEEK